MLRHRKKVTVQDRQHEKGTYTCSGCGNRLFEASKKFDVGSGFPSFWAQIEKNVTHRPLHTYGRYRVQLLCSECQQHLGHLFEDSRPPSGVRYCINRDCLNLEV
jgi:peptide-methionine (R)-S-oxide reductase